MIRALKIVFAANLLIAMVLVGGYIWYGFANGLPIDHFFLGNGRSRGRFELHINPVAPWEYIAIWEFGILIMFIIGRFTRKEFGVDRVLCFLFFVFGICRLAFSWMMSSTYTGEEFDSLRVSPVDCVLGLYVFCSHLAYALLGVRNDSSKRIDE